MNRISSDFAQIMLDPAENAPMIETITYTTPAFADCATVNPGSVQSVGEMETCET